MIVYMKVTRDKYELPIAVADSVRELSRMTGTTENSIWSNITHQKTGEIKRGSFKRVDIGEMEETEGDG